MGRGRKGLIEQSQKKPKKTVQMKNREKLVEISMKFLTKMIQCCQKFQFVKRFS